MVKKILITGKNSYIGNHLAKWLEKSPEEYIVVKKSVRNNYWKEIDFSSFDVVVHVAGIAHQDTKANQKELYYKVNSELTVSIATKAKEQGVKQFIFLSSIIVYGASSRIGENKIITKETVPEPTNFYGNSKLLGEKGLWTLQSDYFKIVIVRPPMIYGKNSKGNYPILAKFARILPVFPDIDNQRSMIHVDNLSEFLKIMIDQNELGIFFPQNKEYIKTSELVKNISEAHGKKIILTKMFNPIINACVKVDIVNKVFGDLVYAKSMSVYKNNEYQVRDLEESLELTEK